MFGDVEVCGGTLQALREGGHVPFPILKHAISTYPACLVLLKCVGARCRHYVQEGTFLLDVATLLPLDILYIWLGTGTPTNRHSF
jgi:hypothetical protein